jgi:F0F1-type ATP synthase membrane subunit b/b'
VVAELRHRAAELATAAAGELIKEKLDQKAAVSLVQSDIEKIKKLG